MSSDNEKQGRGGPPDQNVEKEISKRKEAFSRMQREDSDIERQPDGSVTQRRTKEQQQKLENKTQLHRREAGLESNQSRSTSRRDRRKRTQRAVDDGKHMKTGSLAAFEEADARGEMMSMQPFERIGPDSTSMDGPVTHARAMRGEIPVRGSDPRQPYYMPKQEKKGSALKDTEGLKLTLEANLEIEIELKASIRGDITLSLYA